MNVLDHIMITDLSHLTEKHFEEGNYVVISSLDTTSKIIDEDDTDALISLILPNDLCRKQMQAIFDLTDEKNEKMLTAWGDNIEEVIENGDICVMWARIGFYVGWPKSTELLEFDMWLFAEFHHWHAPFVFLAGTTCLCLRYDPICLYCSNDLIRSTCASNNLHAHIGEDGKSDVKEIVVNSDVKHAKMLSKMVEGTLFSIIFPE